MTNVNSHGATNMASPNVEVRAMPQERIAVFGLFPDRAGFEYAVCELKAAGFVDSDMSVLLRASSEEMDPGSSRSVGFLASALNISETERDIGGLSETLRNLGVPGHEAERYGERISNGGVLMAVHCRDQGWVGKATDSLRSIGAEGICYSARGSAL